MGLGTVIGQIVNNGLRLGAACVERLNLPEQRRKAAAKALAKEEQAAKAVEVETSAAVRDGDKDAVNRRVSELVGVAVLCFSLAAGCASAKKAAVVYVPADREVIPMTTNNVAGWFVPNATFDDLLKAAQKAKALESQQAITARMDGKK